AGAAPPYSMPGTRPAWVHPRPLAENTPTPHLDPLASIVRPSPSDTATCAELGRPPSNGLDENLKSRAPRVLIAVSTEINFPWFLQCLAWYQEPSGTLGCTPTWYAAHSTSSEQSNADGSESD